MAERFELEGEVGWCHDDGDANGLFHTYDNLFENVEGVRGRKVSIYVPRECGRVVAGLEVRPPTAPIMYYPVLYMNDGGGVFWPRSEGGWSWAAAKKLEELIANGHLSAPIIIVAVHALDDRDDEYTAGAWPSALTDRDGIDPYSEFLVGVLKPFLDRNYMTRSEPEFNMIAGASHGGLAAFVTATTHPEAFGFAGCFSSSFWVGVDTLPEDINADTDYSTLLHGSVALSTVVRIGSQALKGERVRRPGLWIDWGLKRDEGDHNRVTEELATCRSREMVELLMTREYGYKLGKNLFAHEDELGGHDERAWNYRLGLALTAWLGPFLTYTLP